MKSFLKFLLVTMVLVLVYETVISFDDGIGFHTRKQGVGCICHVADSTPSVIVRITGPAEVAPNSVNIYRITMRGGVHIAGGFDFNVKFGNVDTVQGQQTLKLFEIPNPGDTINDISHSWPKYFSGDSVSWLVKYIAPPTTVLVHDTLFATGNSVNFNGMPDDTDRWNFAPNFVVTVNPSIGIEKISTTAEKFSLSQNYPNPFNPETKIKFGIPHSAENGNVKLAIYDAAGREVELLLNERLAEGIYEFSWNASRYTSGVYFYRLITGHYSEVKKMILVK
jgi:hypothetical protein